MNSIVKIVSEKIEVASYRKWISDPTCGAILEFLGVIRNHNLGKAVSRVKYEAYEDMALKEMRRLVGEAFKKWDIQKCVFVHRVGTLQVSEIAVCVWVSSPHRKDGFSAIQFLLDHLKQTVPIWKKEYDIKGEAAWLGM